MTPNTSRFLATDGLLFGIRDLGLGALSPVSTSSLNLNLYSCSFLNLVLLAAGDQRDEEYLRLKVLSSGLPDFFTW